MLVRDYLLLLLHFDCVQFQTELKLIVSLYHSELFMYTVTIYDFCWSLIILLHC